jgi:hypothetical protein
MWTWIFYDGHDGVGLGVSTITVKIRTSKIGNQKVGLQVHVYDPTDSSFAVVFSISKKRVVFALFQ